MKKKKQKYKFKKLKNELNTNNRKYFGVTRNKLNN